MLITESALRYYRATPINNEVIELDLKKGGSYYTTCVVNTQLLTAGITTYPCGNGDDYRVDRLELLHYLREERRRLAGKHPVKTFAGWEHTGLDFEYYCSPGDKVDDELVEYFANIVPPVIYSSKYVQAGEPQDCVPVSKDKPTECQNTYATFAWNGSSWVYLGECFKGGREHRSNIAGTRLDEIIRKLEEEKAQ